MMQSRSTWIKISLGNQGTHNQLKQNIEITKSCPIARKITWMAKVLKDLLVRYTAEIQNILQFKAYRAQKAAWWEGLVVKMQ